MGMAYQNVSQYGQSYLFGFPDDAAPTIAGFVARSAELRYEAEVFAQAQDGEGSTDSVVTTNADKRKITGTFGGYIFSTFDPGSFQGGFEFQTSPGVTRYFIIRNVSVPRRKGEFAEISLEAESYALITGPSGP
jgi:hypothetical protein